MALPKCFEASSKRCNRHRRYVIPGLACGKTSPLAWQFLQTSVDYFILISDSQAVNAMKKLARSRVDGIAIVAGNSGAASLAALLALNDFQKEVLHAEDNQETFEGYKKFVEFLKNGKIILVHNYQKIRLIH